MGRHTYRHVANKMKYGANGDSDERRIEVVKKAADYAE